MPIRPDEARIRESEVQQDGAATVQHQAYMINWLRAYSTARNVCIPEEVLARMVEPERVRAYRAEIRIAAERRHAQAAASSLMTYNRNLQLPDINPFMEEETRTQTFRLVQHFTDMVDNIRMGNTSTAEVLAMFDRERLTLENTVARNAAPLAETRRYQELIAMGRRLHWRVGSGGVDVAEYNQWMTKRAQELTVATTPPVPPMLPDPPSLPAPPQRTPQRRMLVPFP